MFWNFVLANKLHKMINIPYSGFFQFFVYIGSQIFIDWFVIVISQLFLIKQEKRFFSLKTVVGKIKRKRNYLHVLIFCYAKMTYKYQLLKILQIQKRDMYKYTKNFSSGYHLYQLFRKKSTNLYIISQTYISTTIS